MTDERLIVALDVHSMDEVHNLVETLGDSVGFYKVGMELFYSMGDEVIKYLKDKGKKVFLDLKLHDIPNTVANALLVAVTILSSISLKDWSRMWPDMDLDDQAVHMAKLVQEAGLDGVVSSPMEAETIRQACGEDFLIVTPGVRPAGTAINDQSRITTPAIALSSGATHLVVGRPIRSALNPKHAAENILKEMGSVKS